MASRRSPVQVRHGPPAVVAQVVERITENDEGAGARPAHGTKYAGVVQLVERFLAKEKVTGAHPVTRSASLSEARLFEAARSVSNHLTI